MTAANFAIWLGFPLALIVGELARIVCWRYSKGAPHE